MDTATATKLLETYGKAWTTQDADLILSIFTPDAFYSEPHEADNHGHAQIRAYWQKKVVEEQKDITFKLEQVWTSGDAVIAEWTAAFTDTKRSLRIELNSVGIFTVKNGKFNSFREFYRSKKTPTRVR